MNHKEIYNLLVEDCKAIIVESFSRQNENTLEARWEIGRSIVQVNDEMVRQKIYGKGIIVNLSTQLGEGFSERNLTYCVKFYKTTKEHKTFSNVLRNLPEGKNTTWHDMCNKHLKGSGGVKIEEKTPTKTKDTFNLDDIELAFQNFAYDILKMNYETRDLNWQEFEKYFIK